MIVGKQSILFEENVYIEEPACVAGQKESEGPLGKLFDVVVEDAMAGMENWEEAESTLQQLAVDKLLEKWDGKKEDLRYIFAGDLLGQLIATSFGLMQYEIPMFGLYGACSTFGEALSLAAMTVHAGYAGHVIALASSHFASAEKQFRYPLEYGNQRPPASTWTVTGCGAAVIGTEKGEVCIRGITTGKVIDFGVKDSMNMGACMAPAACDTILQNLMDFGRGEKDYDRIITGDLGYVGQSILFDLLRKKGLDIKENHMDCGMTIFDQQTQHTNSGGSGCGCAAITLAAYIMPQLISGEWKRILFVPTGALMSTVSFNEGESVPGIAHGIVLEHC